MELSTAFFLGLAPFARLIPVKKGRVTFMSYWGAYEDSPRYISERLHELRPELEIHWYVDKSHPSCGRIPDYVHQHTGFGGFLNLMLSKVVVDNSAYGMWPIEQRHGLLRRVLPKLLCARRTQQVFSTWHGTPLKRMGRDQVGLDVIDVQSLPTTFFLGNQHTADVMVRQMFGRANCRLVGSPRNDALVNGGPELRAAIRRRLGISSEQKIALYAPTFRSDSGLKNHFVEMSGVQQLNDFTSDGLTENLARRFGGDWVLVGRLHRYVADKAGLETRFRNDPRIRIADSFYDMAEYLSVADILITDASSVMFDFAVTGKPCFLYFPDLENYASVERGLYLDIRNLPFPISGNTQEFFSQITNYDETEYAEKIRELMCALGYVEDGQATDRICSAILENV